MERISKYISYEEGTFSQTAKDNGIDNTPDESQLACMKLVAITCFDKIREWYGKPLRVNCFFRGKKVNDIIPGASKTSDHPLGKAIDFTAESPEENKNIYEWAKANLKYDQLIWEFGGKWIHISFRKEGNRNECLMALKDTNGKIYYTHYK